MTALAIVASMPAQNLSQKLLTRLEERILSLVTISVFSNTEHSQSAAQVAAIYHLRSGGRRVRAHLAIHSCLELGLSENDALCIAAASELLHNASLIHDDLQDQEKLRHGCATVWIKFGPNIAICAGDLMLSAAYSSLCRISDVHVLPHLLALVHERTATAIEGQCADLTAQTHTISSIESYKKIAIAKSGALLSLPIELALTACGKCAWTGEARQASDAFALAYQIADDLADIKQDRLTAGLNILIVLETEGKDKNAPETASRLGLQHLDAAVATAHRLPCNSGALMIQLSYEIRESLTLRNIG